MRRLLAFLIVAAVPLLAAGVPAAVAGAAGPFSGTDASFGNVPVGATSAPVTVTITNTDVLPHTVDAAGVTVSGADAADFATSNDSCSGAVLAGGAQCTLDVSFTPSSARAESAQVDVSYDAGTSAPGVAALTGTGTVAGVSITPSPVDFQSHYVGSSAAVAVTVRNTGGAPLSGIGVSLSSGGAAFSIGSDGCSGLTVAPGGSCTFAAVFSPSTTGTYGGSVTVSDNAPGSPQALSLAGTAVLPPPAGNVRAAVGCTTSDITWTHPSVSGFQTVVIRRKIGSYPTSPTDGTARTRTSYGTLLDTGLRTRTRYDYSLFAAYSFNGNPTVYSGAAHASVDTLAICTPMNHSTISDTTPAVDWLSYSGAIGYDLQVWHNGAKIYSPQTTASGFTIPTAHALKHGQTYLLRVYAYTRTNTNPGVLMGATSFGVR